MDPLRVTVLPSWTVWSGPASATGDLLALALKAAERVRFAVTLVKVYVVTAPTEVPSTSTLSIWYPDEGVMVNERLAPCVTLTLPEGLMVPLEEALTAMVYVLRAKVALMVWLALTLVNE